MLLNKQRRYLVSVCLIVTQAIFALEEHSGPFSLATVIIPSAGLGTRFLPYTKSVPKEMLPIIDKPAIHEVVAEAYNSGIKAFCFIVNESKKSLIHYLSRDKQFEDQIAGKSQPLKPINDIIDSSSVRFINQPVARGTGHAVLLAKEQVRHDFFGVIFPDDIFFTETPALKQLIQVAQKYNASVIAVREVPQEKISRYGIISIKNLLSSHVFELKGIVEKPSPADAPSNLAVCGRYILSSKIFSLLEKTKPGYGGEIQLTDAIAALIASGEPVLALVVPEPHDIGNPHGWLGATISKALEDPLHAPYARELISALTSHS